jgi:hypothetical protein
MGSILSALSGGVDVSDVTIEFKNDVPPSTEEKELAGVADELISKSAEIIRKIEAYEDCSAVVRTAISNPTPENESAAFKAVKERVETIHHFFQFSKEIGRNCLILMLT